MNNNNDSVTSQGDGNSRPDANTGTNLHNNNAEAHADASPGAQDHSNGAESVSEARLHANRENAKRSTGPKTARGKAYSRRNALKHGLLAKSVMFHTDGTRMNEDLHQLWDELHEKYGEGDVITDLRIQTVIVECWRQGKALKHEAKSIEDVGLFYSKGLGNFQRYRTASQRALEKNLEELEKLLPPCRRQKRVNSRLRSPQSHMRTHRRRRSPRPVRSRIRQEKRRMFRKRTPDGRTHYSPSVTISPPNSSLDLIIIGIADHLGAHLISKL